MLTQPRSERSLLPPIVPGEAGSQDGTRGAERPARHTGQGISSAPSARSDAASGPAAPPASGSMRGAGPETRSVAERGESSSQSRV